MKRDELNYKTQKIEVGVLVKRRYENNESFGILADSMREEIIGGMRNRKFQIERVPKHP